VPDGLKNRDFPANIEKNFRTANAVSRTKAGVSAAHLPTPSGVDFYFVRANRVPQPERRALCDVRVGTLTSIRAAERHQMWVSL